MPYPSPLPAAPRILRPVHSAVLLEGPAGVALHLHGVDGAITQVPLTLSALREIAALAGVAGEAAAQDAAPAR
ncbi:hypothetical protein ACFQX4_13440 [Roseomonas sp. GCM10028921]